MLNIAAVSDQFKTLPMKKKLMVLAVLVFALTSMILIFTWVQRADYQALYSQLSEEDAGLIIQKLKEQKIPYKTEVGKILVPSDKVHEIRLNLASQGLPQGGGVGFELFDKTSFTMTDFVQKVNYRRALQGELSRTIRAFSEVEQCRVHISVPEKSLFTRNDERPKASVLVKFKQGRSLTQGQVQGIVHLVASSVEGLTAKDVAVVDNRGEMLTAHADETTGITSSQIEYQRNIEKDLENRIMGILEPVVGKEKARAKVAAEIDFTKIEKTEERYDPDSQVARSEQKTVEKTMNGNRGGVPGVSSNLPGKTTTQVAASQGESEKKSETINYEISRITSHIVGASGEIKRQSVVVLVDGIYAAQQGTKEKTYTPRTEEQMSQLEEMVKKAVGFKPDRGDEVRVVNMQFESSGQEELPVPRKELLPLVLTIGKYLVPVAVLALLILLIVRPLIKAISSPSLTQQPSLNLPRTVSEIEKKMEISGTPSIENIIEWTKKNPKEATNLVKNWLEER